MVDGESTQPIEQKSLSLATQPRLPGLTRVRVRPACAPGLGDAGPRGRVSPRRGITRQTNHSKGQRPNRMTPGELGQLGQPQDHSGYRRPTLARIGGNPRPFDLQSVRQDGQSRHHPHQRRIHPVQIELPQLPVADPCRQMPPLVPRRTCVSGSVVVPLWEPRDWFAPRSGSPRSRRTRLACSTRMW